MMMMMMMSMTTALPCSHISSSGISSLSSCKHTRKSVAKVVASGSGLSVSRFGLGDGLSRGYGCVGQFSSRWAGGELRRRVSAVSGESRRRELKIVAEDKVDVIKAAGFIVKAGKNALDTGTDLIPEAVPRGVARVGVGLAGTILVSYALRALFSTALFILAIAGFSYLAYMYINKDSDSGSGGDEGGRGGGSSGKSRSTDESLEEARRIMEKYK